MIPKAIQEIEAADIEALVRNEAEEGAQLDFKRDLIGGTNDEKKEFIADVCSFANAHGGDIIFGVAEGAPGVAGAIAPLIMDPDGETLRLQNIIADGTEPKLFGVRIQPVVVTSGHALVVRVPRSAQGIHRSKADRHFWVRESRSKRSLDVPAIVNRIEGMLERQDRLEEFLAKRYATILTNRLALPMRLGPKVVVHLIPALNRFGDELVEVDLVSAIGQFVVPTRPEGLDFRMTFDGPMHHSPYVDGQIRAYSLVHHSGVVEGAWKALDQTVEANTWILAEPAEGFAARFVNEAVPQMLERLAVDLPLVARVAILGGEGAIVQTQNQDLRNDFVGYPLTHIDRAALVLPDVYIDAWPQADLPKLFQPCFDRLWQASGYQRSYSYQMRDGELRWTLQL